MANEDLPAGAELDRLIAEMAGLIVQQAKDDYYWIDNTYHPLYATARLLMPREMQNESAVPPFSTDMNVVLLLVEDIKGFELNRVDEDDMIHLDKWASVIGYGFDGYGWSYIEEYAPTPALAICRAWLAWKAANKNDC